MQFIFTYHRLFVCARDIVNPLDQLSQPLIHFWHWFTLAYASRDYLLWILLFLVKQPVFSFASPLSMHFLYWSESYRLQLIDNWRLHFHPLFIFHHYFFMCILCSQADFIHLVPGHWHSTLSVINWWLSKYFSVVINSGKKSKVTLIGLSRVTYSSWIKHECTSLQSKSHP